MILGFGHVTLHTDDVDRSIAQLAIQVNTVYRDWPSAFEKTPLLSRAVERHDLVLLENLPAIEVVRHVGAFTQRSGRIDINEELSRLSVQCRNVEVEKKFFMTGIGFKEVDNGSLQFKSVIPQWTVTIDLVENYDAEIDPLLDVNGYSCLAFYVTDLEKDLKKLLGGGGRCPTKVFDVALGERRMSVLMLRSPEGTIIELIKVNKNE